MVYYSYLKFIRISGILSGFIPERHAMDDREQVVSLAAPIKKGIMHLIFSRFFLLALLVVFQITLAVFALLWFDENAHYIISLLVALEVVMVIYLFNSSMDSSAKLTWLLIVTLFPIMGALFLLFTQSNMGHRLEKKRVQKQLDISDGMVSQPEGVLSEIEHDMSGTDDLCRYLNNSGCFPLFKDTQVTYFPIGEDKFRAMLEELEKAEKYIFMEYFIIEEGYMWGRILDVLQRKAKEGVEVRVMYDGMCELSNLPVNYRKLLGAQGIKAKTFSRLIPVFSSHYNYRDHRKILVIDGKVAFNGGVNLADEYINHIERFGHWKDTAVMLKGPAARSFALMFLQMWNLTEEKPEYEEWLAYGSEEALPSDGYVMPFGDCPLDDDKVGEAVYMDILNRATDYVHIMTPYLILDDTLRTALVFAARRGVDVKIIMPGIPDKKMAFSLAKTHYKLLTDAGVKIYEYTPGFVHAKVFVSDDIKAVVGTINLDYRSLYHHFECATYLYRTGCIEDIEKDYQETLAKCRQVTPETIKNETIGYKITGQLAKFIAPLM